MIRKQMVPRRSWEFTQRLASYQRASEASKQALARLDAAKTQSERANALPVAREAVAQMQEAVARLKACP